MFLVNKTICLSIYLSIYSPSRFLFNEGLRYVQIAANPNHASTQKRR